MKKSEFISRYGEEEYKAMMARRKIREKKPSKRPPYHQTKYQISMPDGNILELRKDLDKISSRIQKALISEYKRKYDAMSIIIVEEGSIRSETMKASLNGEIYLIKNNKEVYDWFDEAFNKKCDEVVKSYYTEFGY